MNIVDFLNKYFPSDELNIEVVFIGLFLSAFLWLIFLKTKSKQLLNYIPTLWTSLGVLGTFISLVECLADLQVDPTNILTLIDSISPAFVTSIIGISGALLFSVMIKVHYAFHEMKESARSQVELHNLTPEECLYNIAMIISDAKSSFDTFPVSMQKQLNDLNSLIGNITLANERFLSDHLKQQETFYNGLHEAEGDRIINIRNEYIKSLEQLVLRSDETIKSQVSAIISGHVETISDNIKKECDAISELFKKQKENLDKTDEYFADSLEKLRVDIEKRNVLFCNSLLEEIQKFKASMVNNEELKISEQLSELKKDMVDLTSKWKTLMETETLLLSDSLKKMGDYNRTSIINLHESTETYKNLLKQINLLIATIDNYCKKIDSSHGVQNTNV